MQSIIVGSESGDTDFRLLIPPDFERQKEEKRSTDSSDLFTQICQFARRGNPTAAINVSVSQLPFDIGAGDLAEACSLKECREVVHRRDVDAFKAEVVTAFRLQDENWVGRSRIECYGNRAFRIEVVAPKNTHRDVVEELVKSLNSVSFSLELKNAPVAAFQTRFAEQCPWLTFKCPESWTQIAGPEIVGEPATVLEARFEGLPIGTISVAGLTDKRSAQQHMNRFAEDLITHGYNLRGAALVPLPGSTDSMGYFPRATKGGKDIGIGALFLPFGGRSVVVSSIGHTKRDAPLLWAINKRTIEIIRETLLVAPELSNM